MNRWVLAAVVLAVAAMLGVVVSALLAEPVESYPRWASNDGWEGR